MSAALPPTALFDLSPVTCAPDRPHSWVQPVVGANLLLSFGVLFAWSVLAYVGGR